MLLTIIIVSYNVKYFLEQCLFSVIAASEKVGGIGRDVEVLVIDNASGDDTIEYLASRFPAVRFIANQENAGFSRANSLALQQARGEFILFLNPDTILSESTLANCIEYARSGERVGAIGVRMVDGSGNFLPESKRGFPTPWRSFCKLTGLTSLLPHSKLFAAYQQGHLNERGVHPIEVVAGAFMMVSKRVLQETGGFDERFFMYAEDIDLSKRIYDAGFQNYYLGNLPIIHFKGESTSKDKQYVQMFYDAMKLYLEKHYRGKRSALSLMLMKSGIGMRSLISGVRVNRKNENAVEVKKAFFIGDAASIEEVKRKWPGVKEEDTADMVVICEGDAYPFSAVIEFVEKLSLPKVALIHAARSCSVVSSAAKKNQGNAIALPC
jgi:GT2 family glycosyltransferase